MTTQNNAAQPVLTDDDIDALCDVHDMPPRMVTSFARAIETALLSKLRAPVADERAEFEAAYHRPYPVRSVPKGGEHWSVEKCAAWKGWQDRAALASAPVAGEAQPERGDPASPKDDSDRTYDRPIGYLAAYELGRLHSGHSANLRSAKFGPSALDGDVPVYLEPPNGDAAPQASSVAGEAVYTLRVRGAIQDWTPTAAAFSIPDGEHQLFLSPAAPQAPAGWRWTLHPAGLHPDVYAAAAARDSAEPVVRYCPGCGRIGPVEGKYRDCCPDGNEARMIPVALAEKCRDTFRIAVKVLLADAAANDSVAPQASADTENCGLCGRKQLVNTAPTAAEGSEDDMLTIAYLAGAQAEKERAAVLAGRRERAEDDLPAFMQSRMTPWGLLVQACRIVVGTTLMDMSRELGIRPSSLSSYEHGRKGLNDHFVIEVMRFFEDRGLCIPATSWRKAAIAATQAEQGERDAG
ncbi:hypothetical protein ACXU40_09370 [Bordetella bronchiseptica]